MGAPLPTWGMSSLPLQAGIGQLQVRATSASRKDPEKWRGSSQLGKEPTASSKKPPRAFQLGLFHSKGLCYKAVWEKEGINAPKAAVKSTLQSSCSLCYLILILIEIFPLCCPGYWDPVHVLLQGQAAQPARTRCWAGAEQAPLCARCPARRCSPNATPSSAKWLQIANSLGDSKY